MTLFGCGQLGNSEFNKCTVFFCTEPPSKGAEAPRSQNVVALATLKQKKAHFLLFHTRKVQVCDFAGLWAPGDSELQECTVMCYTEPPYKGAETPRSRRVVVPATLKQKRHLFYFFTPTRSMCVTLLRCGHLRDSIFTPLFFLSLMYTERPASLAVSH